MTIERKSFAVKQLDGPGRFEAIIATLNVIDNDGDIILPGALKADKPAAIFISHRMSAITLGKATIEERGDLVVAKGALNLEIAEARELNAALKFDLENPPASQEWSFGFFVRDFAEEMRDGTPVRLLKNVDVIEVSPVLRGAGIGTGTIQAKAMKTKAGAWDAAANLRRMPSPMPIETAQKMFAAIRNPDVTVRKSQGALPHHFVNDDGAPGDASLAAVRAGIALLNGARGGTDLTGEQREDAWKHLAEHLEDAGEPVPVLLSDEDVEEKGPSATLADQIALAIWDVDAVVDRLREVNNMYTRKGRPRGENVTKGFGQIEIALETMVKEIRTMRTAMTPEERALGDYVKCLSRGY